MKQALIAMIFLMLVSCRSATEKWLDGLADFKELHGKTLSMEIMKVKPVSTDTTALTYKVRIFPAKDWVDNQGRGQKTGLYYGVDSCFSLRSGKASFRPDMVQPVNNGIAGCFEYLISYEVTKAMKMKELQLVYKDKFIDGKQYQMELNR